MSAPVAVDARVLGPFAMVARVTGAIGVPGEHPRQRLRRRWSVTPENCTGSVCTRLVVRRGLSRGRVLRLVLSRTGRGRWAGRGAFWVALRCRGRVYRHGSRVPYRLTLQVTRATKVEGISFARAIAATYVNTVRTDATPCPMGPSHDSARYTGRASSAVPSPPAVSFTESVDPVTRAATFTSSVRDAARIAGYAWNFGDPASGAADTSNQPDPSHVFSAPGTYSVTLIVTDANGLAGTASETVTVTGPPPPAASPARG